MSFKGLLIICLLAICTIPVFSQEDFITYNAVILPLVDPDSIAIAIPSTRIDAGLMNLSADSYFGDTDGSENVRSYNVRGFWLSFYRKLSRTTQVGVSLPSTTTDIDYIGPYYPNKEYHKTRFDELYLHLNYAERFNNSMVVGTFMTSVPFQGSQIPLLHPNQSVIYSGFWRLLFGGSFSQKISRNYQITLGSYLSWYIERSAILADGAWVDSILGQESSNIQTRWRPGPRVGLISLISRNFNGYTVSVGYKFTWKAGDHFSSIQPEGDPEFEQLTSALSRDNLISHAVTCAVYKTIYKYRVGLSLRFDVGGSEGGLYTRQLALQLSRCTN
ncbi:MAG: hypothetical protein LWX70_12105 [Sphingobacteriia bacterium]|nr:hypothetical protein [Sphingobacteriia bacterium]